jgi:hypothetical protein
VRSREEMDAATSCVVYEFDMMVGTCAALAADTFGLGPAHNAFLESELLHARNVIEFLIGRPKRKQQRYRDSDISARDYLPGWTPDDDEVSRRLTEALPQIDKQLSHLSWARVDGKVAWHYATVLVDIREVLAQFVGRLNDVNSPHAAAFESLLAKLPRRIWRRGS